MISNNIKMPKKFMSKYYKLKKWIINKYYDLICFIEDIFSILADIFNVYRSKIENKYWEKYLK